MRIIAGKFKGLVIGSGKDQSIRPAMDHVREYIFNVIQTFVPDAAVCDLFAGSGSLGFEAISRGAKKVVFVDKGHQALKCLHENRDRLHLADEVRIVAADVGVYVQRETLSYDIVFCDPPYGYAHTDRIVSGIVEKKMVNPDGLLIVEHDGAKEGRFRFEEFVLFREKSFGRTIISMLMPKVDNK